MLFTFLLVVHALISASLVAVILMQRSEGGGLGMGGGPSGLMTARGAADFLTRATTVLATLFVLLSIGLAALATFDRGPSDIDTSLARPTAPAAQLPASSLPTAPIPAADPLAVANAPGAGPQDATHVPTGPVKLPVPGPGSAPGVEAPATKASTAGTLGAGKLATAKSPAVASATPKAADADKPASPKIAPASAPVLHLPIITPPSSAQKSSTPPATTPGP